MQVEIAPAGDGSLAADVERCERIDLASVRDADDHAVLLLHRGVGGGRLHAAVLEGLALVPLEIGKQRRGLDRLARKAQRRARTHGAGRRRHRGAILGDQRTGGAVIGAGAIDVVLDDLDAGDLSRPDRRVQVVDGRLFETERLSLRTRLFRHASSPLSGHGRSPRALPSQEPTLFSLPLDSVERVQCETSWWAAPSMNLHA
jgi:hypothetical protein